MADIIIIGGGLAGCVVASRLHERKPHLAITLVEAGPDTKGMPYTNIASEGPLLHGSELDYKYQTTEQKSLDGRTRYNCGVKGLGGGTVINYGGWTRGDASDYNAWAHDVNDNRWSYDGMLPYFKRSETHHDPSADPAHHGFNGPVHTASLTSSGRRFPLREPVRRIFEEALGLEFRSDLNDGETRGISDLVENWKDGKRQIASAVYPLDGVSVLTNTVVKRVILSTANVATGVELASGETLALKEGGQVIVSAGAYRTPQVLMLSGIGDAKHLAEHGIKCKMNSPDVGRNLHDHVLLYRYWTLLHPERGLALGHANFTGENYDKGGPLDFLARTGLPAKGLTAALQKDGVEDAHDLVGRTHLELGIPYAPLGAETVGLNVPFDGTTIATFAMSCLPTSRGTITLHSPSPNDAPIIDPNYTSTHFDRQVLREAFRILGKLALDTRDGKDVIAGEHTPAGFPVLGLDASDEDVDERVRFGAGTTYHAAGSAAMGRVVDGGLKVVGVEGVRVVDASVISKPLAAHYQAPVYAIAEQAVEIMISEMDEE